MKKIITAIIAASLAMVMMVGCTTEGTESSTTESSTTESSATESSEDASTESSEASEEETTGATATGLITVVSREDGSGTRGAFVEITGVDDGEGDNTTTSAVIHSGQGAVMTYVAGDTQAMGYVSLGALDDSVKAIAVDGVMPSIDTILDGTYTVARPFNIATLKGEEVDAVSQDLINFIFSQAGQDIVAAEGYVPVDVTVDTFESTMPEGTITVGGSTSVTPVMEKLVEAYNAINANATINLESVGSTGGMTGATDGTFDIGMASRELKDSELEVLDGTPIAMDGIAMIVHPENPMENITLEQIRQIYVGEVTLYDDLG